MNSSIRLVLCVTVLLASAGCGVGNLAQVKLDDPEFFGKYGEKTFDAARRDCFAATEAYFRDSGHGLERSDADKGTVVSGRRTVYRGAVGKTVTTETVVDNKFYVRVVGTESRCTVRVEQLRAWTNGRERESETRSWTGFHLQEFVKGVGKNLALKDF